MRRAVITGATGMLGRATTELLLKEGYEVICVVSPNSARLSNIPNADNIRIIKLDIKEIESLEIDKADLFFHFAWEGTHGDSRNNMDLQLQNVSSSLKALRTAARLGVECFLGAGSQAEFGRVPNNTRLSSSLPCKPENGYGIGKLTACEMTRIEAKKLGIKHVWVRILSTYGPFDGMHTMVMSGIGNMLQGKKASYTKGEQMWDYLYCKDAARAFYLAALNGIDQKVYMIGSGSVRPLKEYIEAIRNAINPSLPIGFGEIDYYEGQVMYLCADIEELIKDTGFIPEYTFEKGIEETVNWYKENVGV